jgi:hypothetical protein
MPWPRVQITIRRMMIAVAVIALALGCGVWVVELTRLSRAYLQKSMMHVNEERRARRAIATLLESDRLDGANGSRVRSLVWQELVAAHHGDLAKQYRRASERPWQSIPPEPPPPRLESPGTRFAPALIDKVGSLRLTILNLEGTGVTDDLLERVGRCSDLRELRLARNPITDAGLVHLKGLTNLSRLGLGETPISDEGLIHLAKLPSLRSLDLYRTRITKRGLRTLCTDLPKVDVAIDPDL